MAVTVQLNRPHFQIPVGEAIEEILQYVLYHRRQVPVVVSALVNDSERTRRLHSDFIRLAQNHRSKIERFCIGFAAARNGVQQVFKSNRGIDLRRAAIVIGSSPSAPMDLYLIEFQAPYRQPSDEGRSGSDFNGEIVSLTSGERRKIIRQLIDQGVCYRRGDCDFKEISRATKTFLFVEANRGVVSQSLQPRPDLDFLRYCVRDHATARRPRSNVHWTMLKILGLSGCADADRLVLGDPKKANSDSLISAQHASEAHEEKEAIWYQFREPIQGFDE